MPVAHRVPRLPYVVDAAGFQWYAGALPSATGAKIAGGSGWLGGTADTWIIAPVVVPVGQSISKIEMAVHGDTVANLQCDLYPRNTDGSGASMLTVICPKTNIDQTLQFSPLSIRQAVAGPSYYVVMYFQGTPSPTGALRFMRIYP